MSFTHPLEQNCHVRFTKCAGVLHSRVNHCDTWSQSDCAKFLTTCAQHVCNVHEDHIMRRTGGCCETVLLMKVVANQDGWTTTGVCSVVAQCVDVFGNGFISGCAYKLRNRRFLHVSESSVDACR